MNRPRVFRRAAALGAGLLVATAAVLVSATPASAHHSIVRGSYACDKVNGQWVVSWTVRNSEQDIPATIKTVSAEPGGGSLTGITVGATVPAGGTLTGVQLVPATARWARLTVFAEWERDGKVIGEWKGKDATRKVWFKRDRCEKDTPPPVSPSASAPVSPSASPAAPASPSPAPTPSVSPAPESSVTPTPSASGEAPTPAEPSAEVISTCDELVFEFTNPTGGEDIELTLTPSTGAPVTVDLVAGTDETVEFPATEGLTVEVSDGTETVTVAYAEPADCGGSGGGLPVTGAATGAAIVAAAALLVAGLVMYLVSRRRQVRFTA